jgi:DNA-binding beta-propeller fold protein YncE
VLAVLRQPVHLRRPARRRDAGHGRHDPAGKQPVEAAFQPNDGRYGLVTHFDDTFVLVLDRQTGREVKRSEVGAAQANASFTPDGATAFVTIMGAGAINIASVGGLHGVHV